jgi:GNAT superfamily N-acetyltransferase
MTYKLELIEHSNTYEKGKFLRLIDLLSVYEKDGFIKLILAVELDSLDRKGKLETPFHIVKAYTESGALVGYSFYYPKEKTCEFYVLPHWRGKGIGTLLVNAMRENWSGTSVLCAYRGFDGWKNFFDRNFILEMDPYENGGSATERNARKKSAKLSMSRQMTKAGITA